MKQAVFDRSLLVKYLLGQLEEPELELVEGYFEDDKLFDELLEVEDELLERFVRGELAPSEQKQFASYLDKLPGGRERLKFAAALAQAVDRGQQEARTVTSEPGPALAKSGKTRFITLWQWLPLARRPHPVLQFSLVAGLVIAAVGGSWLVIHSRQLSTLNAQLRAQVAEREAMQATLQQKTEELQQQMKANAARLQQSEAELEQERQRGDEQAQEIAKLRGLPSPLDEWSLTPLESRAASDTPDSVVLRRGAKLISIAIPIESGDQRGTYRAVLQTTEGDRVLQQDRLPIMSRKTRKVAVLRIEAARLAATSYKLTLIDPEGLAHDYYFSITKR
jgi:hypothetical protein